MLADGVYFGIKALHYKSAGCYLTRCKVTSTANAQRQTMAMADFPDLMSEANMVWLCGAKYFHGSAKYSCTSYMGLDSGSTRKAVLFVALVTITHIESRKKECIVNSNIFKSLMSFK
jgi:hypothetical protein